MDHNMNYNRYNVEGTVINSYTGLSYGRYSGSTAAPSIGKAKSNVLYHAKQAMKLPGGANIKWFTDVRVTTA